MEKIDVIVKILEDNWSAEDLIRVWNDYCSEHCCCDDEIFYMDSFNELMDGLTPLEIVERVQYGDFRPDDDYFAYNGYGNIVSFCDVYDFGSFNYQYVAEHLVDNGDSEYTEVDNEALLEGFIDEYFMDYDFDTIKAIIEKYMEEETFDLLMGDWDLMDEEIRDYIEEGNE